MTRETIVITGLAPLSAIGIGKKAVWKSIINAQTGLVRKSFNIAGNKKEKFYTQEIKNFDINKFGIERKLLFDIEAWKQGKESIDLDYLLAATKLALDDSGLSNNFNKNKTGLILTHENPGLDQFYLNIFKTVKNKPKHRLKFINFFNKFKKQAYDLQTFMFLYHVAKVFDIHGYSLFLNNACASGLYALEAASDVIKSGKCDIMVVAAADHVSIFKQLWFSELGMYPKDGKIKPFAMNRDGFVLGDGAAGIILETLESALKRKAHIYAEYLGGGFSLEGWKVTIPNILSKSYENAILEALQRSKMKKEQIDLIVPHGVGTTITDSYEAKAITNVFGKNFDRPLITALKPYIGHTLGSTALLETIISLLSLENNLIPPTLDSERIDQELNIKLVSKPKKNDIKSILKLSCGFAGYNGAIIFRKL